MGRSATGRPRAGGEDEKAPRGAEALPGRGEGRAPPGGGRESRAEAEDEGVPGAKPLPGGSGALAGCLPDG